MARQLSPHTYISDQPRHPECGSLTLKRGTSSPAVRTGVLLQPLSYPWRNVKGRGYTQQLPIETEDVRPRTIDPHSLAERSTTASNTACRSNADRLISLSTSEVAVCCSRASFRSRASRATSIWPIRDELRRGAALGALRPFSFNALRRRALAGLPPALEGFFIASAHMAGNEVS